MDAQPGGARLDLYIEIDDRPAGMLGRAQYNSDLFTEETILRIVRDFRATLVALIANPEERLSALASPIPGRAWRTGCSGSQLILWNTSTQLPTQPAGA